MRLALDQLFDCRARCVDAAFQSLPLNAQGVEEFRQLYHRDWEQDRISRGLTAKIELPPTFDLAIGNPPFSDRIVQSDPAYKGMGLRLHDYFIVKAIDALRAGGLAAFVTSHGTMDKRETGTRERISASADLLAAIRLPEGAFRATAGTDVVTDVLEPRKYLRTSALGLIARQYHLDNVIHTSITRDAPDRFDYGFHGRQYREE